MPRPLHPRNFKNTSGSSIKINYHNGSTATTGYIVKQMGTDKYKVTSNGSVFFIVELAQTTDAAATLTAGYGTIVLTPYGGGPVQYVKKLTSKRALTTAGNVFSWGYAAPTATQARLSTNGDDTTPSAFSFTDITGATISTVYTSAPITLAGLTAPTTISVAGTTALYSINGGAYVATAGTVQNGDVIRARVTSSGSGATARTATVTVGGVSDVYSVTTA